MKNKELTKQEIEILTLVERGLSTEELLESLFISSSTLRNHFTHIFKKLDAKDRKDALRIYKNARN